MFAHHEVQSSMRNILLRTIHFIGLVRKRISAKRSDTATSKPTHNKSHFFRLVTLIRSWNNRHFKCLLLWNFSLSLPHISVKACSFAAKFFNHCPKMKKKTNELVWVENIPSFYACYESRNVNIWVLKFVWFWIYDFECYLTLQSIVDPGMHFLFVFIVAINAPNCYTFLHGIQNLLKQPQNFSHFNSQDFVNRPDDLMESLAKGTCFLCFIFWHDA